MTDARPQSTLEPAPGSAAVSIDELGIVLFVGGALVLAVVCILAIAGIRGASRRLDARRWLLLGGLVLPGTLLVALFLYALDVGNALVSHGGAHGLRVHVDGKQWWWEVRYESGDSGEVRLANELHIPLGQPVEIVLTSTDVIHSFWVPALAGKVDMIPGRTTRIVIQSDRAGIWRGQCAEYCGAQHALMAFHVVAQPAEKFEAWLAHQAQDAARAHNPEWQRGQALFFRAGCAGCHAVRGTAADGQLGPDLTHVGSRHSLAAGTLGNHVGTMAGWIAGTQDLKPGSLMPSTGSLTGVELRALAAWLESLE